MRREIQEEINEIKAWWDVRSWVSRFTSWVKSVLEN
jgi:hypothetical protein